MDMPRRLGTEDCALQPCQTHPRGSWQVVRQDGLPTFRQPTSLRMKTRLAALMKDLRVDEDMGSEVTPKQFTASRLVHCDGHATPLGTEDCLLPAQG